MGANKYKYQILDFAGNTEELQASDGTDPGILSHSIVKSTDNVHTCTFEFLVDFETTTRIQMKETLKGSRIQVIYDPDDTAVVHFDGWITHVHFTSKDSFNLTARAEGLDKVLRELRVGDGDSDTSSTGVGIYDPNSKGALKITSVDNGNKQLASSDVPAAPGGYVSEDHAALIVPASYESGNIQTFDSLTAGAKTTVGEGAVADLTDTDLTTDVMLELDAGQTDTTFTLDMTGTSTVAHANSTAIKAHVYIWIRRLEQPGQIRLQYYDYNAADWDTIALKNFLQSGPMEFGVAPIELWGYKKTGEAVQAADDEFKIRLEIEYDANVTAVGVAKDLIRCYEAVVKIFDDLSYDGTIFPIDSYSEGNNVTLTTANPATAHFVAANDTMLFCRKLGDVVDEIFDSFSDVQIPFTYTIDTILLDSYTSVNFRGMRLVDVLNYCQHFTEMHWYFEHTIPQLRFYAESHFHEGVPPALTATSASSYSHDANIRSRDTEVSAIKVKGGRYKRNDGTSISVDVGWPENCFTDDGSSHLSAHEVEELDYQYVLTGTECSKIAQSEYDRLSNPDESWTITLVSLDTDGVDFPYSWDLTLEGVGFDDIPLTGINLSYVVADDHITHSIVLGWHHSPPDMITGTRINDNKRSNRWLNEYTRQRLAKIPLQSGEALGAIGTDLLPAADGTYDLGSNTAGEGGTPLEWEDLWIDGKAYIDELGEDLNVGGYDLQNVAEITGTDTDHKIEMDPAADQIRVHPGDDAGDIYFIIRSEGTGNTDPALLPSTATKGSIGISGTMFYSMWAQLLYAESIVAYSDAGHMIDLDPAANRIDLYPGDGGDKNYFIFKSEGQTDADPQFYPNANGEGQLGISTNVWRDVRATNTYTNVIYGDTDNDHKIEMDPAADQIRVHPGDDATDYYWVLHSVGSTNGTDLRLYPSTTGKGYLGKSDFPVAMVYTKQMRTDDHQTGDIGEAANSYDDVYADDFQNTSAWKNFVDALTAIKDIAGVQVEDKMKVDHSKVPAWVRTIDKVAVGEDEWDTTQSRVSDTTMSINRMQVVLIQAIQQLLLRVEELEKKVNP